MTLTGTAHLHVLIATPGGRGGIDRMMDAVDAAMVHDKTVDVRIGATRGGGHAIFSLYRAVRFAVRLAVLRFGRGCDVLHLNVASRGSTTRKAWLASVAYALGVPYVVHLHGGEYRKYFANADEATKRRVRRFFRRAAQVVVLGSVWRDFIISEDLADARRVHVLHNAAPHPRLAQKSSEDGRVRILFLGVLGPLKGVPQLVEALARISATRPWRAVLAGDGDVAGIRAAVAAHNLNATVAVPGWVDAPGVERLLADADILVLPSFAENLPMSVIEAMAAGLAVITTPVGAIPDIIRHGETGMLVAAGDVAGLAEAISTLVSQDTERRRLGSNAKAFHDRHLEIGQYSRRLVQIWRNAAS